MKPYDAIITFINYGCSKPINEMATCFSIFQKLKGNHKTITK